MEIKASKRTFRYNNIPLQDPDPKLSIQQVRDYYANIYPEITTAEIDGPENKGGDIVYTFRRAVGTKGAAEYKRTPLERIRLEQSIIASILSSIVDPFRSGSLYFRAGNLDIRNVRTIPTRRYLARLRYAAQHPARRPARG